MGITNIGLALENLRGQCSDGCTTMAGAKSGDAKQSKKDQPHVLCKHCYGHATSLSCSNSIWQIKVIRDAHDTVSEVSKRIRKFLKTKLPSRKDEVQN